MLQDKLKLLRKRNGVTQEQLAEAVGLERSSIGKYESPSNPVEPSLTVLRRIASFFDVTVDYLIEDDKPATKSGDGLTADERMVLDAYRNASDEIKRIMERIARE